MEKNVRKVKIFHKAFEGKLFQSHETATTKAIRDLQAQIDTWIMWNQADLSECVYSDPAISSNSGLWLILITLSYVDTQPTRKHIEDKKLT